MVGLASENSPSAPGCALDVVGALESCGLRALRVTHTLQAGQPGHKRRCLCAPGSHPRGPGRSVRALVLQLPPLYTSRDLREEKLRKSVLWYLSSPLDFSQVENSEMKIRFKGLLISFHMHDLSLLCVILLYTTFDLIMEWWAVISSS